MDNYSNSSNPETKIWFKPRKPAEKVSFTVYNIKGQKVWEYKAEMELCPVKVLA
ncbi:MAG: hypothetical protein K9N06_00090 [Candidatus Cloacimonetes bacterium]|nr:hypothetical protein [Candidatus Cloacimonadota bacterium]